MQSYSVMRDGFPPFSHSHNHPPPPSFPSDPSPSSSSSAAANPPPHLASQRARIPAFAQTRAPSTSRSSTEPAAHALSRPDNPRPFAPSYSREQNASGQTGETTTIMSGPLPTTNRHIPAFGSSSSSTANALAPRPSRRPSTSSDPSRHSPEAENECAAALSALAASAPSPSPAPSSQPLPSHLPLLTPDGPPLSAQSTLSRTATACSADYTFPAEAGPSMQSPGAMQNGERVLLSPESGEGSGSGVGEGEDGEKGGKGKKELKQTKRAAQNRAAQRAFRERKQQQIRDLESRASTIPLLESRITSLEARCNSYELERQAWDRERCALLGELETLRRVAGVEREKRSREGEEEGEKKRVKKLDEESYPRVEQTH
ncbi:hypothetical protein JCM10295v2_005542 [Rhodotorula toruloides]